MKKRLLSVLLVLVMVLSMIPVSVSAEGVHTPGTHTSAHQCETCGADATWSAWTSTNSLPTSGHYYLTGNVDMSKGNQTVLSGNLCLCLNGYTITGVQNNKTFAVATAKLALTITDCTAVEIDGVYYAGKLTGGLNTTSNGGYIYLGNNGQKLYFYDGIIENNRAYAGGGAIWAANGSSSSKYGSVFMYGGELRNNVAADASNVGKAGGAVNLGNYGKFYMTGGKITGNEAKRGGGIYAGTNATVVVKNASVTGNHASELAGGVYMDSGTLALQEEAIITGNTGADQAASNLFLTSAATGAVANTLKGNAKIGVTLASPRISAGNMTVTTNASGTDAAFFESDSDAYVPTMENGYVVLTEKTEPTPPPVVENHTHNGCGDAACTDHAAVTYEKWTDPNSLPTSGSYYLETDVTLSNQTIMTGDLNLCLNGHTVNGPSNNRILTTGMNAFTLTLSDCTATEENGEYKAGRLTGAVKASTKASDTGGAIYIYSGSTFYLFDGIIENNQAHQGGGGVHVGGTMYMENGLIRGNKSGKDGAWKAGGAINMGSNSKLYITGGEISGNQAKLGGGIYVHATGTVEITDAVITGNKVVEGSSGYGAGVYAPGGSVKLAGQTRITGNNTDNLFLDTNMAGVNGNELTGNALIGVTLSAARQAGSMAITTGADKDLSKYFVSDDASLDVAFDQEVVLQTSFVHEHCVCGEASCTAHEAVSYMKWADPNSLPTIGNYCLETDVTLSTQTIMTGDLNLCLHGKTITGPSNNRIITTGMNAFTLTISDCTATVENGEYKAGRLTGAVKASTKASDTGGAVYIYSGSTFYLYDGIIEGNQAHQGGGAIHVGGTMYMENGVIRNNKGGKDGAWKAGGAINMGSNSKLYISGGEISGNEAKLGGGIYVHSTGTFEISNAKVLNNTAETAGGIYLAETPAAKLAGNVQIRGNLAGEKASNLIVSDKTTLDVAELGAEALVGVTASAFRYISGETADVSAAFSSDTATLSVIYKDGKLFMDAADGHSHCFCTAELEGCDHTTVKWAPWESADTLPTSGNYYLTTDVTVEGQTALDNTKLNLCLNGHTIKTTKGRIYYTKGDTQLTITDCTGGGVITGADNSAIMTENKEESKPVINVFGGIFTGNTTPALGGAILCQGSATLNVYGGTFENNTSIGRLKLDANGEPLLDENGNQQADNAIGGAAIGMYSEETVLNIYGGTFKNNKTTHVEVLSATGSVSNKGGYGVVYSKGIVNVKGGSFTGGEALLGGAFFVTGEKAVLTIDNATITENNAKGGGAILLQSGATVNLNNAQITGNTCGGAGGGAIYLSGKSTLNLQGGTIRGNSSPGNGGALYISEGTANLLGGEISGNKAGVNGAGVFVNRATAIFGGTTVKNNAATNNGGGIYGAGATLIQLDSSEISGNTAKNGAGIYATQNQVNADTLVYSTVVFNGGTIKNNTAETNCGGMLMVGKGTVLTMNGGTVSGNTAKNAGGILVQTSATMNMKGGKITGNKATVGGGGLYISVNSTLNMQGGTISGNDAANNGGGMLVQRGYAKITGGTITGNTATTAAGVYFAGAKADIYNIAITGNTSRKNCGGMMLGANEYTQNGVKYTAVPEVNMYGGTISGNSAPAANAGGVLLQSKGSILNFHGGTITGNTCAVGGGGVYASTNSIFNMDGGEISGNEAKTGGAIHCQRGFVTITGGQLNNNKVTSSGGAIYVTGNSATPASEFYNESIRSGIVTLKNVQVFGNEAASGGAMEVLNFGTIDLEDCKVYDNISAGIGGGVYINKVAYSTMKNVEIYNNQAQGGGGGGLSINVGALVKAENLTVYGNTADGIGGGIYNRGRLELNNSLVRDNATTGNGGGIGTFKTSSIPLSKAAGLYVTNSTITGNRSVKGAGLYLHVGCESYLTDVTVTGNIGEAEGSGIFSGGRTTLENVTATGNTSLSQRFALYFDPAQHDGMSYYTGKKVLQGKILVKDNEGGEMYLDAGVAVAIPGEGLAEGTEIHVQLDSGLLTQRVIGTYNYEGENLSYVITAGNRSITDPEIPEATETQPDETTSTETTQESQSQEAAGEDNTVLYLAIGGIAAVILLAAVILVVVKKKAARARKN